MKAALMNQNTLQFVAPPGPLASAPVASANIGLYYKVDGGPLLFSKAVKKSNLYGNYIQNTNNNASGTAVFQNAVRLSSENSNGFRFCIKNTSTTNTVLLNRAIGATSNALNSSGASSVGSTITNDGSTGWCDIYFGGSLSAQIPPMSEIWSDVVFIDSIDAIDSGNKIYLVRFALQNATGFNFSAQFINPVTKAWYIGGSDMNPATALTELTQTNMSGFELYYSGAKANSMAFGDSITYGYGSTDNKTSWFDRYIGDSRAIKKAVSGSSSLNILAALQASVTTNSSLVLYPPYTPNDSRVLATVAIQIQRAIDAYNFCKSLGVQCVFTELTPVDNNSIAQDEYRASVLTQLKNMGYPFISMLQSISTGEIPNKFISGKTADGLHPNESGYIDMTGSYIAQLDEAIKAVWVPV